MRDGAGAAGSGLEVCPPGVRSSAPTMGTFGHDVALELILSPCLDRAQLDRRECYFGKCAKWLYNILPASRDVPMACPVYNSVTHRLCTQRLQN